MRAQQHRLATACHIVLTCIAPSGAECRAAPLSPTEQVTNNSFSSERAVAYVDHPLISNLTVLLSAVTPHEQPLVLPYAPLSFPTDTMPCTRPTVCTVGRENDHYWHVELPTAPD